VDNGTNSLDNQDSEGTLPLEVNELSRSKQVERLGRINPELTSLFPSALNNSRKIDPNIFASPIAVEDEFLIDPQTYEDSNTDAISGKIDAIRLSSGNTVTISGLKRYAFCHDMLKIERYRWSI
jgi:hypothetical protein